MTKLIKKFESYAAKLTAQVVEIAHAEAIFENYCYLLTDLFIINARLEMNDALYCRKLNNKERNLLKRAETTRFNRSLLESKSEVIEKALAHFNADTEFVTSHKLARYINECQFEVKNRRTQTYETFALSEQDMIAYVVRHCNHLTSKLSHLYKREANEKNLSEFKIVRREQAVKLLTIAE